MDKTKRPRITRISKLKGFDSILVGRDFAEVFKDGHVYDVMEIADTIIIKDLGEHALMHQHNGSTFNTIMMNGTCYLTKEEKERQDNQQE